MSFIRRVLVGFALLLRRILTALSTGYVVFFFSESMFWGQFKPETPQHEFIVGWIVYSLFTYMMLTVISRFRVRTFWSLFLAGAVYGWIAEGLYVQTMYNDFPINISFTGLAWHALLSVCGGWYLLRRIIAHGSAMQLAMLSIALGLFWGLWSVFWWIELGTKTPLEDYFEYAVLAGVLLVIALFVENLVQPKEFGSTGWEAWPLVGIAGLWFYYVTIPAAPISVVILPPLMGLVFFALRKNRRSETQPDILFELKSNAPLYRYLIVLLIPVTTFTVYAFLWDKSQGLLTNWVVYLLATPAGFLLLIMSLYKVLKRPVATVSDTQNSVLAASSLSDS